MQNYTSTLNSELPPLIFDKKSRGKQKYTEAVMDAFERIGLEQVRWNIEQFDDFYKMCDGTLSHKELKMMAPQYEALSDLLAQAEIPANVTHWDIIGGVINTLVGKLIQMQDKFHATDTGEPAESDFMDNRNSEVRKTLEQVIQNKLKIGFAEKGIDPASFQKIQDPQQQQQIQQALEEERRKIISESTERLAKTAKFKTAGVQWAEATLEKDKEILDFSAQYKSLFKSYLLTGICAKITKVIQDTYKSYVWDSRTVFHSKDIDREFLNDFSYAGRVHFQTPSQVIEEWGEYIGFKEQKELLEGDELWKNLSDIKNPKGSAREVLNSNFNKEYVVPYTGYHNTLYMKKIEDLTGLPMGEQIFLDNFGEQKSRRTWIPRDDGNPIYSWFADYIETRFPLNSNICQVTEVYFRAMEPIGYLTYEDDEGNIHYGEPVSEDILPEYLKENNIKQIRNLGFREMVETFEVNTIVWQLRPIIGWGVKIVPSNSMDPIYLGVEPMEHQPKGLSDYDVKLPVTGFIGKSTALKLAPWQELYNYNYNSIRQLIEKELGMFFLMDIANIPSEFNENGDTQEAMMTLRNMAKRVGIMGVTTNPDEIGGGQVFNQFAPHNISHAAEIKTRVEIANLAETNLYKAIGVNPSEGLTPTQYVTNDGIKVSQEATQTQIAHIYEDFNRFVKVDQNQHLSVAQYVQANNMDRSLYYTKSDLSIGFLKVNDPKLPLRLLGLVVTDDNRKKKELEVIKSAILQRNTMDLDAKALINLTTTDSWRELMDVANEERELAQMKAQLAHDRQIQQLQAQAEGQIKADEERWKREEYSKALDRKTKIDVETIQAYGRASDKQANEEDFRIIEKARDTALQETKVTQDFEARQREIDLKAEEINVKKQDILSRDEFKREELRLKEKEIDTNEKIARMNKN